MVRKHEDGLGDEALRQATGRGREEWRAHLLETGAREWDHARIARHLVEVEGVDGWWAQGITVDFEQAHQGRLPGQQKDGTFSVSVTRTLPAARLEALDAVTTAVTARHGEPHSANRAARYPVVRWRLDDGTRLSATAQPEKATGTPVSLTRERLPGHPEMEGAREELVALLEEVAHRVG